MEEQEQALQELGGSGVLAALGWSHRLAYDRMGRDYDPATGHNDMWRGTTAAILLRDRLDRVGGCGQYASPAGEVPEDGAALERQGDDLLGEGLDQGELDRMPRLPSGTLVRDDVQGSPGWRCGRFRVMPWSSGQGDGSRLPWHQAGPIRRRMREQPDPAQMALWEEDAPGLLPDVVGGTPTETISLFLVHGEHALTGRRVLLLGRPDAEGGWLWRVDLLAQPLQGAAAPSTAPVGDGADEVEVTVRLRSSAEAPARGKSALP